MPEIFLPIEDECGDVLVMRKSGKLSDMGYINIYYKHSEWKVHTEGMIVLSFQCFSKDC